MLANYGEFIKRLQGSNAIICGIDANSVDNISGFVKKLLDDNENLRILILSSEPKFEIGKVLLALGIKGYANSYMKNVHFQDAINTITKGNTWLYPEFIQKMIQEMAANIPSDEQELDEDVLNKLSTRELDIAKLIQQGLSNKEISEISSITLRTVKAHTTAIYNKLGVKDRVGLVLLMQKTNV